MPAVVIPTNSAERIAAWFDAWRGVADWDETYICWDGPRETMPSPEVARGFSSTWLCWDDMAELVGEHWIFSKQDAGIRCFGIWMAHRELHDFIGSLDDDCFPDGERWFGRHLNAMKLSAWESTVPGRHVRGLPYKQLGERQSVLNIGLWRGCPDDDAIHRLALPQVDFEPPRGTRIVPSQIFVPMCGMNLVVARAFAPALYFPLMGQGQPYSRFDDIWAGVLAKKIADHLGLLWTVGEPHVRHTRASDPLRNLTAEAAGIVANERFWQLIDEIEFDSDDVYATCCVVRTAEHLSRAAAGDVYLMQLAAALRAWIGLFFELPPVTLNPR